MPTWTIERPHAVNATAASFNKKNSAKTNRTIQIERRGNNHIKQPSDENPSNGQDLSHPLDAHEKVLLLRRYLSFVSLVSIFYFYFRVSTPLSLSLARLCEKKKKPRKKTRAISRVSLDSARDQGFVLD